MTRILIVDDSSSIREFLKINLSSKPDIQIVGLADSGDLAITQADKYQPDIILMDINMPGIDGIQATQKITQRFPQIKVLLLTSQDDKQQLERSLKAGSRGYILKNTSIQDIADIIRLTEKGFFQIGPILGTWDGKLHHSMHLNANNLDNIHASGQLNSRTFSEHNNLSKSNGTSEMSNTLSNLSSELFQLQETIRSQEDTITNLSNQYSKVQQEIHAKRRKDKLPYNISRIGHYGFKTSRLRSRHQNILFISSFLLGILTVLFLGFLFVFLSGMG